MNAPPMGSAGGYGSHKDIKLTLLNKVAAYIKIILTFFSSNSNQVADLFFCCCFFSSPCSNKQTEAIERGISLQTRTDQHLLLAREWQCLLIEVRECCPSSHKGCLHGKTSVEIQSVKLQVIDMHTVTMLV